MSSQTYVRYLTSSQLEQRSSIYVWAAGNGGKDDNCAADGYVCSIYTIGIGAATSSGSAASFDEECSCKMATTFVEDSAGPDVVS